MGQGNYIALGYGALDVDYPSGGVDSDVFDDWLGALEKIAGRSLETSYESERKYLAIFVAENAGIRDDTIIPSTCLLANAAQGPEWDTAREIWERIRAASQELGVPLPEGQPLLIVDYD